jgi:hypothetical protein
VMDDFKKLIADAIDDDDLQEVIWGGAWFAVNELHLGKDEFVASVETATPSNVRVLAFLRDEGLTPLTYLGLSAARAYDAQVHNARLRRVQSEPRRS